MGLKSLVNLDLAPLVINYIQNKESFEYEDTIFTESTKPLPLTDSLNWASIPYLLGQRKAKSQSEAMSLMTKEVKNEINTSTKTMHNESDLTGNPLEAPFETSACDINNILLENFSRIVTDENINEIKPLFCPVSTERAKKIMQTVYLSMNKEESCAPFWIVCDANDVEKTVLLGCHQSQNNHHRANVKFHGYKNKKQFPSVNSLLKLQAPRSKITSEVQAMYNIFNQSDINFNSGNKTSLEQTMLSSKSGSFINLKCSWTQFKELLEFPSPLAECTLLAKILPGDERSPCYTFFHHYQKLTNLVEGLSSGDFIWSNDSQEMEVMDALEEYLKSLKNPKAVKDQKQKSIDFNFEDCFQMNTIGKCADLDFTDELWQILSECSSFDLLERCLKISFSTISDGEIFPFISPKNNTRIATFVRNNLRDKTKILPLDSKTLLHCLIEIGIRKLKKDLFQFFASSELVTLEIVTNLLQWVENDFHYQLRQLHKLLCVVELIAAFKTFIDLPKSILSQICRDALVFFKGQNTVDGEHVFEFSLPVKLVRELSNRFTLESWKLCLSSNEEGYHTDTAISFTANNIFPVTNIYLSSHDNCTEEEDDEDMKYYCYIMTSISDKNF